VGRKPSHETYSNDEAERRVEAALRGACVAGYKPQSEMKLGKPRGKPPKSPTKSTRKEPGRQCLCLNFASTRHP